MANDTAGNPYIIDTVTDTAIIAAGTWFKLYAIRWVSASAADAVAVQDAAGIAKWASIAADIYNVEAQTFPDDAPLVFNGLKVPTLTAGKVYLYVKSMR